MIARIDSYGVLWADGGRPLFAHLKGVLYPVPVCICNCCGLTWWTNGRGILVVLRWDDWRQHPPTPYPLIGGSNTTRGVR